MNSYTDFFEYWLWALVAMAMCELVTMVMCELVAMVMWSYVAMAYRRLCDWDIAVYVIGISLYMWVEYRCICDWNIAAYVTGISLFVTGICARWRSLLVWHWLGRKSYLGSLVRLKHCERRLITYPSSDVWPGRPKWTCVRRAMLQMAPLSIIPPLLVESAKVSKCFSKNTPLLSES